MSEFNFTIEQGASLKLATAGKYCDKDILVTADDALDAFLECSSTTLKSNASKVKLYAGREHTVLTDVILPNAELLEGYSFYGCSALKNIDMPKLETIGNYSFYGCESLEEVYLPKCRYIYEYAFRNCIGLKRIKLPTLFQLYKSVFMGCTSLECIDFSGCKYVVSLYDSTSLNGIPTTCQIIVPASLLDEWKTTRYWSNRADQIIAAVEE